MPYFGVKVVAGKFVVTAKLHGPLDIVLANTHDLKEEIKDLIGSYNTVNLPEIAKALAVDLCAAHCDGNELLWVQVEVALTTNGVFYGASAEKIGEPVP